MYKIMSGLLFLSSTDFKISQSTNQANKGNILSNNIKGTSLILFYSTQCQHCHSFLPIFKKLPGTIIGCQFGMINISTNRSVVDMSNDTIMPLTYVPYIVLYVNGQPIMVYEGPADEDTIRNFVMEVVQSMQTKQQFISDTSKINIKQEENKIPSYALGIPKGKNKCYLTEKTAYNTNTMR